MYLAPPALLDQRVSKELLAHQAETGLMVHLATKVEMVSLVSKVAQVLRVFKDLPAILMQNPFLGQEETLDRAVQQALLE